MNVSAVIVTRGNVDLQPVLESLPDEWEKVIWDNGLGRMTRLDPVFKEALFLDVGIPDISVYGRYQAIQYANNDLIFVQDDDVVISDPQAIVDAWLDLEHCNGPRDCIGTARGCSHCYPTIQRDHLVANTPQEFRHDGYTDSCLVGFGACFYRDLPTRAFETFWQAQGWGSHPLVGLNDIAKDQRETFLRTCDVVFTTLTPRVLVDVPKTDREFASDPDRMWKQPQHYGERVRILDLARQVRDA